MLEDTTLTFDALLLESGGRSKDVNILGIPSTQVVQGAVEKSPEFVYWWLNFSKTFGTERKNRKPNLPTIEKGWSGDRQTS